MRRAVKYFSAICASIVMPRMCLSGEFFRCGSWLVSADVSVAELIEMCGKPCSQHVFSEDDRNEYGMKVGLWTTEIWRYDRGSTAAPMIVTIVNGQIRSIERGK